MPKRKTKELEHCPGPVRTVGAVFDPSPEATPKGVSPKFGVGAWINNPHPAGLEFCPHGFQYAHFIKDAK